MKTCPRCGKTYLDSEVFCEDDGTALVQGGAARAPLGTTPIATQDPEQNAPKVECPVCGGKAEPGEVICNFCGTRLAPDTGATPSAPEHAPPSGEESASSPENFIPAHDRLSTAELGMPVERNPGDDDESSGGRRFIGIVGYTAAAIIALAAGAWLALYLTERPPTTPPVVQASPSPSPAAMAAGPTVQLATTIPLQITGESAAAPERSADVMSKAFNDNRAALLDGYRHALEGDSALHSGMVARIHITPDGKVSSGAIRVSTSLNPGLDAEVVKEMSGWTFAPVGGGGPTDADFPIIFANKPEDVAAIASDLSTKLASLSPTEAPEYSSGAAPSPVAAVASPPAAVSTPAEAALPPPVVPPPSRHERNHELASAKPRPRPAIPPLLDRVIDRLHADRKFRRVKAYTSGGTVTLFGKVFDDNDKVGATRVARSVSGVTNVVNNITTDTAQWEQYQNQILSRLQNAGLSGVTVKVIGKDAYLDGEVKTALDKERAVTVAQAAAPVTVRTNLIRVAPGNVFGF